MATATQILEPRAHAVKIRRLSGPTETTPKVCYIRIVTWIREMASLRGMTEAGYLIELARADYAEHRVKKLCATAASKAERAERIEIANNDHERTKLRAEDVQRLLFLAEKTDGERLSTAALALRMGVSKSTVQRILKAREQSAVRVPQPRGVPPRGARWGDLGGIKWQP